MSATSGGRRRCWSALLLLFVGALGVFGVFARGHVDNLDAVQSVYAARSLWLRGDLGLPPTPDEHSMLAESMIRAQKMGMEGPGGDFYVWFPVGYQLWLTPAVAVGGALAEACPDAEARLRELERPGFGDLFWVMFAAGMMPVLAAAGGAVVLFLLGRELGLTVDGALLVAGLTTLATQYWPMMLENLSDGPGLCLLLAAVLQVVRWLGRSDPDGGMGGLFWGGQWAGLAVLMRYPHALSVLILAGFVVWGCRARTGGGWRRWGRPVVAFAGGGLPWLALLLGANYLRFGDLGETGYGAADLGSWFNYPMALGLLFQLAAFGKGLLWLSPLLIPCLWWGAVALRRGSRRATTAMIWLLFLAPLVLFANTDGWQAGEAWGLRYVAPGMVLLIAYALAVRRPWAATRRAVRLVLIGFALCGLGAAVTGLVAPVRGYLELAARATRLHYENAGQPLPDPDLPLHMFVEWRFSPLHGHWTYAKRVLDGSMETSSAKDTMAAMFGVEAPDRPLRLQRVADLGFRHWWWVWLGHITGRAVWPWMLLGLGLGLGCLWGGRRLLLQFPSPASSRR